MRQKRFQYCVCLVLFVAVLTLVFYYQALKSKEYATRHRTNKLTKVIENVNEKETNEIIEEEIKEIIKDILKENVTGNDYLNRTLARCNYPRVNEKEATSIALIKVHKTGSTTLSNILYRFGIRRGLSFIMVKKRNSHQIYPKTIDKALNDIHAPCKDGKYDILNIHLKYNGRAKLLKIMHKDTRVVATLRHPLEQMRSTFNYYGFDRALIGTGKTFEDMLEKPEVYIPKIRRVFPNIMEYSWNSMSIDIGLSEFDIPVGIQRTEILNTPKYLSEVERFLEWAESEIDFFVLSEEFDECIVLLKDYLNLQIEDFVYFTQNAAAKPVSENANEKTLNKSIEFSYIDHLLYDRVKTKLDKLRWAKGEDLAAEVAELRRLNQEFANYCLEEIEVDQHLYGYVEVLGNTLKGERENDRCCYETAFDEKKYVTEIQKYMENSCQLND